MLFTVWVILLVLSGVLIWALLHERSMRDKAIGDRHGPGRPARTPVLSPEEEALEARKTVLESQLRQSVQKERASDIHEAIEQLKAPDMSARLEALDALNTLLQRSPNWEQWNILNILQTHLENTFSEPALGILGPDFPEDFLGLLTVLSERPEASWKRASGTREKLRIRYLHTQSLRLKGLNLRAAEVSHCVFKDCDVEQLDLYASTVTDTAFQGGNLRKANVTGATFKQCDFTDCDLRKTEWVSSTVENCDFSNTCWSEARLRGARFHNCSFKGADLRDAKGLTRQHLEHCELDKNTRLPAGLSHGLK